MSYWFEKVIYIADSKILGCKGKFEYVSLACFYVSQKLSCVCVGDTQKICLNYVILLYIGHTANTEVDTAYGSFENAFKL